MTAMTTSRDDIRHSTVALGRSLGLPEDWLRALPEIGTLPGATAEVDYGADAFLTWKRQEMLVRSGRLDEIDRALVAEALEDAAGHDGPGWLWRALDDLLFVLAWPKRTYHLHVRLRMALDHLRGCLEASPSMRLFEERLDRAWQRACFEVTSLDEAVAEPPEACPWPDLDAVMAAAEARLAADGRIFR